jgi:hypothetical protein
MSVEQSSPDHPWARESQTTYSASLNCETCNDIYQIVQRDSNKLPMLVLKSEVREQEAIQNSYRNLERRLLASAPVQKVLREIIAAVDGQQSNAAKHRILQKFHLAREAYSTYARRPYGGAEAVKYSSGRHIAETGIENKMFSDADLPFVETALGEIRRLRASERSPKPIKTGATWMSH